MLKKERMVGLNLCVIFMALALTACGAARPAHNAPQDNASLIIEGKTYDEVWLAALPAMTNDFNLTEIDKQKGVLRGSRPMWLIGQEVAVYITTLGSDKYRIDVVSTHQEQGREGWEKVMLERIASTLKQRKGSLRSNM